MKTVVIYHSNDFDGIFCREIAKKFIPDAILIGWDYGQPTPGKEIIDGTENLFILDLSVPDLMDHPKLVWIDHHKSAIEKYPATIAGYRIDGVAACRLAWQWFAYAHGPLSSNGTRTSAMGEWRLPSKQEYVDRIVAEPFAVRLAGEYDIWDKRDPRSELFQHGLRSRELSEADWSLMLELDRKLSISEIEALIDVGHRNILGPDGTNPNPVVLGLLENGKAIQYAKTQENAGIITSYGFDVKFEGLTFLACNHARFNSHLFIAGLKDHHDALLGFNFDGKNKHWRVSLYHAPGKEHHDLSLIAKKYGGGGHRGACGFSVSNSELFFELQ